MTSTNPYAAPKSEVHDPFDPELVPDLASRGSRFLASLVDSLILACLLLPLNWWGILPLLIGKSGFAAAMALTAEPLGTIFLAKFLVAVITLLAFFLINGKLLKSSGQTVGKRLLSIAVVQSDGNPAGTDILLKRYVFLYGASAVPVFGPLIGMADILAIFGAGRLCLHDRLANTKVVIRR